MTPPTPFLRDLLDRAANAPAASAWRLSVNASAAIPEPADDTPFAMQQAQHLIVNFPDTRHRVLLRLPRHPLPAKATPLLHAGGTTGYVYAGDLAPGWAAYTPTLAPGQPWLAHLAARLGLPDPTLAAIATPLARCLAAMPWLQRPTVNLIGASFVAPPDVGLPHPPKLRVISPADYLAAPAAYPAHATVFTDFLDPRPCLVTPDGRPGDRGWQWREWRQPTSAAEADFQRHVAHALAGRPTDCLPALKLCLDATRRTALDAALRHGGRVLIVSPYLRRTLLEQLAAHVHATPLVTITQGPMPVATLGAHAVLSYAAQRKTSYLQAAEDRKPYGQE